MNFKLWLESLPNAHQEIVNGWRVYYDLDSPDKEKVARSVADRGTATLQSLNVRKSLRVPIVFVWDRQGINRGIYNYEEKTPHVVVELYFERDPVGLLIHEIGHAIYSRLSAEQQNQIDVFAKQTPNISSLGEPPPEGYSRKRVGEEWFPECIRLLARGGGLTGDNASIIPREVGRTIKTWISDTNTAPQSYKFYATDQRPRHTRQSAKQAVIYNPNAPIEKIIKGKTFHLPELD